MKRMLFGLEVTVAVLVIIAAGYMHRGKIKKETDFRWENYKTAAHALGGLDGKGYLNARECFLESYEKGQRLFEVDFLKTEDGKWVCRHNWREPLGQWKGKKLKILTEKEFLSAPIYGKYTPMNLKDFFLLLKDYPDAYVLIDSKQYTARDHQMTLEDFSTYMDIAKEAGAEQVLDQFIPEIYNQDMLDALKSLHDFPTYLYALWQEYSPEELKEIAVYCREENIPAVAVYRKYWTEEIQKIFDEEGIRVFVYTVNDLKEAKGYLKKGAAGLCSDTLADEDLIVKKKGK